MKRKNSTNDMSVQSRIFSKLKGVLLFIALFTVFRLLVGQQLDTFVENNILLSVQHTIPQNNLTLSPIYSNSVSSTGLNSTLIYADINEKAVRGSSIYTTDSRILAMREFLIDHHSPLYPYADVFVEEADKAGLDWRLVASISGVESAFGNLIPYQTNNGWGWRGGPNGAYSVFTSWSHGISTVTERLAIGYGTDLTPFEIEPAYCPPCYATEGHPWANGVTKFMNDLDYYLYNLDNI